MVSNGSEQPGADRVTVLTLGIDGNLVHPLAVYVRCCGGLVWAVNHRGAARDALVSQRLEPRTMIEMAPDKLKMLKGYRHRAEQRHEQILLTPSCHCCTRGLLC